MRLLEFFNYINEGRLDYLRDMFAGKLNTMASRRPEDRDYARRYGGGDVLTVLAKTDPTKNKQFVQWLIKLYLSGNLMLEDLYKAQEYLTLLMKFKNKLPPQARDINRYKNLNDLYDVVKEFVEKKTQGEVDQETYLKMHNEPHAEVVYNDKELKIVIPKTREASCFHGIHTRWCTAADRSDNRFSFYNERGPLYIILHKPTNRRWQFHFERGEFVDDEDRVVNLLDLVQKIPKIREVFGDKIDAAIVNNDPNDVLQLPGVSEEIKKHAIEIEPNLIGALVGKPTDKQRMAAIGAHPKLFWKYATPDEEHRYEEMRDIVQDAESAEEIESGAGSIEFQYRHRGMAPDVFMRIMDAMEEADASMVGYSQRNRAFLLYKWDSFDEFIHEELGETANFAHRVMTGDEFLNIYDINPSLKGEAWESLETAEQRKIGEYIRNKTSSEVGPNVLRIGKNGNVHYHGDEEGESYDPTDFADVMNLLDETGDPLDFQSGFISASLQGAEMGAEAEMSNDFYKYLEKLSPEDSEYEYADEVNATLYRPYNDWEKPVYLIAPEQKIVELASETELERDRLEDWNYVYQWPDLRVPYDGWTGFDEFAARESLIDHFHRVF